MNWKIFLIASACYIFLPAPAQATVQISPSFGNQLSDEGAVISKQIEIVGNAAWMVNDVPSVNFLFGDGFEGLSEGSICTGTEQCATGLLCCYPCGIEGCENQCTVPIEEACPLYP